MAGRPWTHKEIALLRERYGLDPPAALAARLGRGERAVRRKALRLGLAYFRRVTPEQLRALRRLRARGWSDGAVARELGLAQSTVTRRRRALGLPPALDAEGNPNARRAHRAHHARMSRARNARARLMEYPRWADYMASRRRLRYLALRRDCTTRAQAAVCLLLDREGPLPAREVARTLHGALSPRSARRACAQLLALGVLALDAAGRLAFVRRRRA